MTQVLELQFETTMGKTATITIDAPKPSITASDIQQVMATIIAGNVFEVKTGAFVAIKGARIIDRQVSTFDLTTV
ncbi:DUF2922 domain-containing protein [Lysinibacillus parviboronicapiens]|uniref:DUF2922 domain-containing protein n=1 Tax=Lysinibacillus parviboronicapiens TaxID=436516 RepID=UPI0006D0C1B0|nr:DUF2922 domain-containing protein [Lysinibacillus parviboronicapiens]